MSSGVHEDEALEIVAEFLESDSVRSLREAMESLNETMRSLTECLEDFHMDVVEIGDGANDTGAIAMDDAMFAQLPDVVDGDNANRLAKAALIYVDESGGPVDPAIGFSLQVCYSPTRSQPWEFAIYQQDRFVRGVGVAACMKATAGRIRHWTRIAFHRAKEMLDCAWVAASERPPRSLADGDDRFHRRRIPAHTQGEDGGHLSDYLRDGGASVLRYRWRRRRVLGGGRTSMHVGPTRRPAISD